MLGTTESWGCGQRFGLVPLADGPTYWFATANAPEHQHAPDGEHTEVLRRFAGWHAPIDQVVTGTAARSVLRHDVYDLRPGLRTFLRGRVVLLGDAAHAMTPNLGQGACQALEDSPLWARSCSQGLTRGRRSPATTASGGLAPSPSAATPAGSARSASSTAAVSRQHGTSWSA